MNIVDTKVLMFPLHKIQNIKYLTRCFFFLQVLDGDIMLNYAYDIVSSILMSNWNCMALFLWKDSKINELEISFHIINWFPI